MRESVRQDEFIPTTKRIIGEVLHHVGMKAPEFAKTLGVGYQRIFDLQRGRTKKFNPGLVNIICEKFPDINKSYLFTGEGSLLVGGSENTEEPDVEETQIIGDTSQLDPNALLLRVIDMMDQVNSRAAQLTEFERKLNEREASLNAREIEVTQREENLGILPDKKIG